MFLQNIGKKREEELAIILSDRISEFSKDYSISDAEMISILEKVKDNIARTQKTKKGSPDIPLTIFQKELGCMESITLYLKNSLNLKFSEIAKLSGRDQRTVWNSYYKAKKKAAVLKKERDWSKQKKQGSDITLPLEIISDRERSVLGSIVFYLKTTHNLTLTEIASLLDRAPQNIWTVYNKSKVRKEGKR